MKHIEHGVYTITNLINGKIIVGSIYGKTSNFSKRKSEHFLHLRKNTHSNPHLQASYNINGKENFIFEILEYCEPEFALDMENWWINMLDTKNPDRGYNIETPGKSMLGRNHTEETKKKISEGNKGKIRSEEVRKEISLRKLGVPRSLETREKIGNFNRNKKQSQEILKRRRECYEINGKKGVPILQYTLEGEFVNEFVSLTLAAKAVGLAQATSIWLVIKGTSKTAGGYKWKLKD